MQRFPVGEEPWYGYALLASPSMIIGVDRRAFFLVCTFSYIVYTATGLLMGVLLFGVSIFGARYLCRRDPHIMTILPAAAMHQRTWYDYADAPSPLAYGPIIVDAIETDDDGRGDVVEAAMRYPDAGASADSAESVL